MAKVINPFIITGRIPQEYFCDRIEERDRVVKSLTNGNNLVIISPRRIGKTGLIQFCYDMPTISRDYYTFFIDILHTSSLAEFTYLLGRNVFESLLSRGRQLALSFLMALKSVSGRFSLDSVTGAPSFSIELGQIEHPEYTLEEIFQYLEKADKPCLVAVDEFQQITAYQEKNIEALLRSHIQRTSNCNFIFAGSERHLMQEMFTASARPFYNSADIMELNEIRPDIYALFVTEQFRRREKSISPENVRKVYDLFEGNTFYLQRTFNESFAGTERGSECSLDIINESISTILGSHETIFREMLSNIPPAQKEVLYAVARSGKVEKPTSAAFVKGHSLKSASSVQSALSKLLEKGLITRYRDSYCVADRLFSIWINSLYGITTGLPLK